MATTPWATLTDSIKKLSDRLDAIPVFREATAQSATAVRFDTDTVDTTVQGSLVRGILSGDRVLTVKIRHYVWVIGVKGGPVPPVPVLLRQANETNSFTITNGSSGFRVINDLVLTERANLMVVIEGNWDATTNAAMDVRPRVNGVVISEPLFLAHNLGSVNIILQNPLTYFVQLPAGTHSVGFDMAAHSGGGPIRTRMATIAIYKIS